jgi:hypothetical protein
MKSLPEKLISENSFIEEANPQRKSFVEISKKNQEENRIDNYLKLIENEIKKNNFNMDQRCFIENIFKMLDNLSKVN